jgi:hypothetical protein
VALDPRLSLALFGLLACNTAYYLIAGRASEALESLAWYTLLLLFALEAARNHHRRSGKALALMRGARALATVAITVSAVLYVREKEWLDAGNLFLWIAVVALLEVEVRHPARVAAQHRAFAVTAAVLYSALGILVLIWLVRREWMDAWDAALWLAAFGVLELGLLGRARKP